MIKNVLTICIIFCAAISSAAQNMDDVVKTIPDSIVPGLSHCDSVEVNTQSYIRARTSAVSSVEMKLLSRPDSSLVVAIVSTAEGPAADSSLRFYDLKWNCLPAESFYIVPKAADFLSKPADMEEEEFRRILKQADINLVRLRLFADSRDIEAEFTGVAYKEELAKLNIRKIKKTL